MVEQAACLSVLDGTTASPNKTVFNNGNGTIYILDGINCWNSVNEDINSQLAQATAGLRIAQALNLPTGAIQDAIEEVASAVNYSDGIMIFTAWQWDEADLNEGDQVGLCFYQESGSSKENYSQCWSYLFEQGAYSTGNSYQIRPSQISKETTLQDF